MPEYSQEQLLELYNALPKELQEALFSEQNARNIHEICIKNNVKDEDKIFGVSQNVGYVLLGLLPPSELRRVLEKDLGIDSILAQLISEEIARFILYPLRKLLEPLYETKITIGVQPSKTIPRPVPITEELPAKKDIYREPAT